MTNPTDEAVRSYFRRWSSLQDEKDAHFDDSKELFAEAKAFGCNTKAMRAAFTRKRKLDAAPEVVQQDEKEVELYLACLDGGTIVATRADHARASKPKPKAPAVAPPHDPDTGEIIETRTAAINGGAAESREVEGASPPLAEAPAPAAPQNGEPSSETAATPFPPITRQIAVFDGVGRAIGGEASRAGPRPYPLDDRGLEHAGDIPESLRRA